MTPEEWDKVAEIYHAASKLEGEARLSFLEKKCSGDDELRREVESLLTADSEAGDFIAEPVVGSFATDILKNHDLPEGEMFGHCRILSKLGSGGMGDVFLAEDTKLGRRVAIKTLSSAFDGDENFLKRFRNEARAAANLNHPSIATLYSVEEHDGRPFIALEYIDGVTLDRLVPRGGVDLETFAKWFVPVADALAHAHARGVVHRDVKPGNIMISKSGDVKILDFGLAYFSVPDGSSKTPPTNLTQAGQIIGTPSYMSPEQAKGKDIDHRSDIFSLGVVMYEAITGIRPFEGDSNAEIVSNLLKSDPPPIEKARPSIPANIAILINRCLEKKRRNRPKSMGEVRDAIANSQVSLSPSNQSLSQRFYRQVRSGGIWPNIVFGALILALALVGWFYFSRPAPVASPLNFANLTIRRLSQSSNVVFASITPDGKSIVYNATDENGNRALWIRRVDDRNALRLVEAQPVQYWGGLTTNADSSQIYYITADRAGKQSTMYRISALGGSPRKIADNVNDLGSLSVDGRRVLYVRYRDQMRILSASAEDGSDERVIREEDPENKVIRDPQYSADGNFIYYSRMDRVDGVEWWTLVRIPADGGPETVIIPRRREKINELAVLQDGTGLLINGTDPVSNLSQLFYMSLPDRKLSRLTNDVSSYFGVSVDRAGRAIVAAQRQDEKRIWVGDTNDLEQARSITPEPNIHRKAEWTPDGRIVYDAVDNGVPHIWIMDADGKNQQQLTPNDSADQHPSVSSDGRYIVFTSSRNGFDQVWLMNIDGSNQTLLAKVEGSANAPRFSADGQTVFFHWVRGNRPAMGKIPVTGGDVTELERVSESEWAFSPDGSRMAYITRDDRSGTYKLAILRLDAPTPDVILDSAPIYLMEWSPDSNAIYVRERDKGANPYSTIVEHNLQTKKESEFLSTAPDYVIDLSFSRDGKQAAIVRGKLSTDAIMLSTIPR